MTKIVLLLNIIVLGIVDAFVATRSVSSVPSSSPSDATEVHRYPVYLMSTVDRRRASPPSSSSSSTSSTSRIFPSVFPGQSLAHNLHEAVLGVLINSNGQNALSKQSLHDVSIMPASTIRPSSRRRQSLHHPPSSSSTTPTNQRTVQKVEKFERIPAWPARIGLQFNALSKINPPLAAKLEDQYGGADCPNLWFTSKSQQYTSPFLMMCHHNHSFDINDPIRMIQKNVIPEGFPSHGHRGMTTVTIVLRGGLVHRDSLGNKQIFGAEHQRSSVQGKSRHLQHQRHHTNTKLVNNKSNNSPYNGKHTQWLSFGKGLIHELMWDNEPNRKGQYGRRGINGNSIIHQELFQVWIDLPNDKRYMNPRIELLGDEEETPTVTDNDNDIQTTVIAGTYNNVSASVDAITDLSVFRVQISKACQTWAHTPPSTHSTTIIYVRTGSIMIGNICVPVHCTAYLSPSSPEDTKDTIRIKSREKHTDFLVLAGQPLNQKVTARGSMVVETPDELEQAFVEYEKGDMGVPWSESCTDDEWRRHLRRTAK